MPFVGMTLDRRTPPGTAFSAFDLTNVVSDGSYGNDIDKSWSGRLERLGCRTCTSDEKPRLSSRIRAGDQAGAEVCLHVRIDVTSVVCRYLSAVSVLMHLRASV